MTYILSLVICFLGGLQIRLVRAPFAIYRGGPIRPSLFSSFPIIHPFCVLLPNEPEPHFELLPSVVQALERRLAPYHPSNRPICLALERLCSSAS
jgi:hypothetical protein